MKKHLLLLLSLYLLFSSESYGQEYNTARPMSSNAAGTTPIMHTIFDVQSTAQVPQMTSVRRTAITNAATGLLVFDTDTAGFWFYDGVAWADLSTRSDGDSGPANEYNTRVGQNSTNAQTAEGSTTSTDLSEPQDANLPKPDRRASGLSGEAIIAEEKVGINSSVPTDQLLEVDGDIHLTNVLGLNHFIGVPDMVGNYGNLTIHAAGQPEQSSMDIKGGNLILSAGNLNTSGSAWSISGTVEIIAGKNLIEDNHHGDILFRGGNSQSEIARINGETGNMGIGTSSPTAKLHIAGDISIVDGTQGEGKVLTCDADGLASWQQVTSPSSPTLQVKEELDFIVLAGGSFEMGCLNCTGDDTVHTVTLSPFRISKYEVTNEQYADFLNANGNQTEEGVPWQDESSYNKISFDSVANIYTADADYERHPVVEVTWYGARAFAGWLGGRLPTEAEWEYAAHGGVGGTSTEYSGSNIIDEVAWYDTNSGDTTHVVGSKQANELGLYDMSGNVWEWCNDWYEASYYDTSPDTDPQGPAMGTLRVLRGGSWNKDSLNCRVTNRHSGGPTDSDLDFGFRVVLP